MKKVTFSETDRTLLPFYSGKLRGGHPRKKWTDETMEAVWKDIRITNELHANQYLKKAHLELRHHPWYAIGFFPCRTDATISQAQTLFCDANR